MASRNRDLTIALIAKSDKFDLKEPTQDLDKLGDAAKDAGTDVEKGMADAEKAVKSVASADTRRELDNFFDKIGKSARQARLDQDYGIAFQQAGLLPWRTVAANVALPLELHGAATADRRSRIEHLLEFARRRQIATLRGLDEGLAIRALQIHGSSFLVQVSGIAARDAQPCDDSGAATARSMTNPSPQE